MEKTQKQKKNISRVEISFVIIFLLAKSYIYCMNILFTILFLLCLFLLLCTAPELFLSSLLEGAGKGASICISLIATYSVWMGLIQLWEDCGIARAVSKRLKPFLKWLFKTEDEEALQSISMNVSVNLLGLSGASTPYGIQAISLLDKTENAEYASALLFVLNATSLQLFPTSLLAVRVAMHSVSPYDIVFPILLASLFSSAVGFFLTKTFIRPTKTLPLMKRSVLCESKGAGLR